MTRTVGLDPEAVNQKSGENVVYRQEIGIFLQEMSRWALRTSVMLSSMDLGDYP